MFFEFILYMSHFLQSALSILISVNNFLYVVPTIFSKSI